MKRLRLLSLAVFLTWWAVPFPCAWAAPTIRVPNPSGGQRGTELDILLPGNALGTAQEVVWYEPGITVKSLEAKPEALKTRLAIAPDCPVGLHRLRVRTATGISNLVTFSVGSRPEIAEVEPNNDLATAQKIPLDCTINGSVQNEDADYFLIEAKKGQRITAEVEGMRLGQEFFDPHVEIVNLDRFVLAAADNTPAAWYDAICSAVIPADGKYAVLVRETAYGGSGNCRYRLHVGCFPRPLAVCPGGGKPGSSLEVQWLGEVTGPWTQKLTLPALPPGEFALTPQTPQSLSPWPLPFRLSNLDNTIEHEPNGAPAAANKFTAPGAVNGVIEKPGDIDCFRFAAKKGQVLDLRVYARALRTPLDSVLSVLRTSGATLASNDDSTGPDSYLRFTVPADDEYVLQVTDQLHAGGPQYAYRLEVQPVAPQLTLTLPEREQFVDMTAAVPRGGRFAMMVTPQREDLGGPVELEFKNLPPGVKVEAALVPDGQTMVPVLLSAPADADLKGSLVDLVGRCKQSERVVEGHLRQRTSLLRGNNNREVWNQYTDRMAVAVTQESPFSVEIVAPKAPLVQYGSLQLKVGVVRKPPFDAPVTLTMLYNPPGVSTTNAVTVEKGKSEVVIPLTADGSAGVGTWKIIVMGRAQVAGDTIEVASALTPLEISPPLFKFTFPTLTLEQGKGGQWALAIEKVKGFGGVVKAELVGLPGDVSAPPQEFKPEDKEIVFALTTAAKSPLGRHKSVLCRAIATVAGEPVAHLLGTGELRLVKPVETKPPPKASSAPKPAPAPVAAKRLSRLEQLRQAQAAGK